MKSFDLDRPFVSMGQDQRFDLQVETPSHLVYASRQGALVDVPTGRVVYLGSHGPIGSMTGLKPEEAQVLANKHRF